MGSCKIARRRTRGEVTPDNSITVYKGNWSWSPVGTRESGTSMYSMLPFSRIQASQVSIHSRTKVI